MTPIMLECEKRGLEWRWVYAAQHRDTFEQTLRFFGLPDADYTMVSWDTEAKTILKYAVWMWRMTLGLVHSKKALKGLTGKEHIVLTHGDTTSTVYGALMGKLTRTKVMHVESGLRSFSLFNPFPEEINRLITFRLSDYYACPGDWAMSNVQKFKGVKINTKQNTQMDVLRFGLKNIDKATIKLPKQKYVVLSTHRFENVYNKERFEKIIKAAEKVAKTYKVIMPQHPVTDGQLTKLGFRKRLEKNKNFILMPRLEYENYLKAIIGSEFVMTDGGGNQEELYHLGKPTLLLRDETERKEGLGKTAVLSKLDPDVIDDFVANYKHYQQKKVVKKDSPTNLIVDAIKKFGET
jgi:UDP-N-acetylglucosamine 2-epimerase (non-hydrolysing)